MNQDVSSQIQALLKQQIESWGQAGLTHISRSEEIFEDKIPVQEEITSREETKTEVTKTFVPGHSVPDQPSLTTSSESEPNMKKPAKRLEPRTTKNRDSLKKRKEELELLRKKVARCKRCKELASTRTQTVFGVGDPNASIMFIGEAPGADEDKQGEPFVGRAGKLLTQIIEACKITREEIYICNILRCRPPGNRNPSPEEADSCREFLDGQISIVDPDYIVCWGSVAAKNLLDETLPIGKLRGEFHEYGRAKVLCTYHPSYLLRNPPAKKDVWKDMKFLFKDMGIKLK